MQEQNTNTKKTSKCWRCGGSGVIRCFHCNGEGMLLKIEYGYTISSIPCASCHGSGTKGVCKDCHGRGYKEQ